MQVKKSINFFSSISKSLLILLLITGWVFSGWPQIGNFPPKVQETSAVSNDATVEVLGGGGGGGVVSSSAGGGGGGGEYHRCTETLSVQSYTVTVGAGGSADANPTVETDSVFSGTGISMTADGGTSVGTASAGAAGTGGTVTGCDSGPTTFAGGTGGAGITADYGGGAGGGAGYGGKGGNGVIAVSGRGGGGGGGGGESGAGQNASAATGGTAGAGGGGTGGNAGTGDVNGSKGGNGVPFTYHIVGGGGGGGSGGATTRVGGACSLPGGGSGGGEGAGAGAGCRGEVRIIYVDSEIAATGGTETTNGIYRIHTFTTNGTFQVSTIELPVVDTPTYDNDVGTYNNDVTVTISDATSGATIKYCTDTNNTCDPTTGTTGTSASITATGTYLRSIATNTGYNNSTIKSALYTLQVANPSFGTNGGSFNNDTTSTQTSTTTGAVFCQTVDGTTSPAATTPGTCSVGTTGANATIIATGKTIKVLGTKANYVNSAIQTSSAFTLTVANPAFGTNGGSFNNDTTSTQTSTTTSAVFCQTVDGTTSPAASTPGTCSVGTTGANATIIATGKTIKVLGTKTNYVNSAVQTSSAFTLTVGAITSSPGAGTYTSEQDVTLNIATTTGAVAHYTTNGSAVSCASTTYSSPFHLSATATVKAIGCKTNYVSDTEISDLYTLNLNTAPSFSGNPTDSPDSVVAGYNVTFSGTANDSESNSWYLAVCKTNSVNAGAPPTCASSQLLCISTSAVATGSPNTCTWASTGSSAQNWFAFACDNNASPACSSVNSVNSPVTVNAVVVSVSVLPATTNYGIMAINQVRKADTANANDEFIITNAGNVPADFDIISSDAIGGTGWTLSPTAVGSSIFMHAYSTLKNLAASFTLGSIGQQATNWVALDKDPNYRTLASNVAVSGTTDLILELLSPSGMGNFGVSKDITITIRVTQH